MLIRAAHLTFSEENSDVILAKRNMFCQRLVASAEGPFTTVCIITRPPRRRKANKVFRHYFRKLRLCLNFGSLFTNSQSKLNSDVTRNFTHGGK